MKILVILTILFSTNVYAKKSTILINTDILKQLNLINSVEFEMSDLTIFEATEDQLNDIHHVAHHYNRCGGYELIDSKTARIDFANLMIQKYEQSINNQYFSPESIDIQFKPEILAATEQLDEDNLRETVYELSQFKTRSSRQRKPNQHVFMMQDKVDEIIAGSPLEITSELIEHQRTKQKTLKARIEGLSNPDEVIIIGGHLDSTAFRGHAPGADDNASGSSNVLEILRVASQLKTPKRSIEFFWYAAEEVGLVGSSEIAKDYKSEGVDVIAVMQLDMTGFAGSGVFNIANITDYTSPWLQKILLDLNKHYARAIVHESKCGYGCSDHASWYRQGFNTVFPIEAKFRESNRSIHSPRDVIDKLNFEHSLVFAKLGLSFILELANSDIRAENYL